MTTTDDTIAAAASATAKERENYASDTARGILDGFHQLLTDILGHRRSVNGPVIDKLTDNFIQLQDTGHIALGPIFDADDEKTGTAEFVFARAIFGDLPNLKEYTGVSDRVFEIGAGFLRASHMAGKEGNQTIETFFCTAVLVALQWAENRRTLALADFLSAHARAFHNDDDYRKEWTEDPTRSPLAHFADVYGMTLDEARALYPEVQQLLALDGLPPAPLVEERAAL